MAVVAGGTAVLSHRGRDVATPVAVDAAAAIPPVDDAAAPISGAVSLAELAREARDTAAPSTTRPRTTTTTRPARSTTTTAAPRAATTTTTARPAAAPVPAPATTTTVSPLTPLTTLVEKVVPDAAAASSALTRSDSGVASWFKTGARICAHRTLPMGTEVKVTRTATGASATCTVADRGPAVGTGRLIDLSPDTFDKLADRGAGLIDVTIQW